MQLRPPTRSRRPPWMRAPAGRQPSRPRLDRLRSSATRRPRPCSASTPTSTASPICRAVSIRSNSTNKHATGRFYVQRPGKIRFDYAPPSSLRIVADGAFLAIEDSDLKTVEKYPIKSTPFRLLLADAVDLGRDARIVGVESQEGTIAISLEDNSGDASGSIKLIFDNGPDLQLKQWQITDAQGLTTQVTVNDVVSGRKVAADFFTSTENFQPFR